MSDLISRSALLDSVQKFCGDYFIHGGNAYDKAAVEIAVKAAPTVDAVEVRHGQWIDRQPNMPNSSYRKEGMSFYCSNCLHSAGKFKHTTYKYCPWCGAKMDGERKEDKP